MKKISLLAIAAFAVLSMTSCKKDRTCTCTNTVDGVAAGTDVYAIKDVKKGVAAAHCVSTSQTQTYGTTSHVVVSTCKLK